VRGQKGIGRGSKLSAGSPKGRRRARSRSARAAAKKRSATRKLGGSCVLPESAMLGRADQGHKKRGLCRPKYELIPLPEANGGGGVNNNCLGNGKKKQAGA